MLVEGLPRSLVCRCTPLGSTSSLHEVLPYYHERESDVVVDRRTEIISRRPALYGSSSGQVTTCSRRALE